MKKEFNGKKKRIVKKLEKQQSKAFTSTAISLLFIPIFLTYFSDALDQRTINSNELYSYMRLISASWTATIVYGFYSLYKLMNLERTLNTIKMNFQDIK